MNKLLPILLFLAFLFSEKNSWAQIHIDTNEDVGVGDSNTEDSKLKVANLANSKGLYVKHSFSSNSSGYGIYSDLNNVGLGAKYALYTKVKQNTGSTNTTHGWYNKVFAYGTGTGYGIENQMQNVGTGVKYGYFGLSRQNASSTERLYGIANYALNYGTGTTFCNYNYLYPEGTGAKYGSFGFLFQNANSSNALYGRHTYLRNLGSGPTYGTYNYLLQEGTGAKDGIINNIQHTPASTGYARGAYCSVVNKGSGASYGLDVIVVGEGSGNKHGIRNITHETATNGGTTFGIYNLAYLHGKNTGYGLYSRTYDDAGSENIKYGLYNYIEDHESGTGNRYGIYTYTEKRGSGTNYALWSGVEGGGDYAGYFSGNVVVTGTMMDGTSDARLKEKIENLDGALAIVAQLQPKSYHFKKDKGIPLPEGRQYGLIAQELESVMPDLVSEFTHPGVPIYKQVIQRETLEEPAVPAQSANLSSRQAEGRDELVAETITETKTIVKESTQQEIVGYEADQVYKTIDYKALIPVLIGAIQEQQAEAEALKTELRELKAQVAILSKK